VSILDAHTHSVKPKSVVSVGYGDSLKLDEIDYFSVGVHPWIFTQSIDLKDVLTFIENISFERKLVAIGETGLDKLFPQFENQKLIFNLQINLSIEMDLPVIIHSVKSQNEILKILKSKNLKNSILFHGFNGSKQEAFEILNNGHYIGVGPQLLKNMRVNTYLSEIPLDRILIETDDTNTQVDKILHLMSLKLEKPKDFLKDHLNKNFFNFFNL
tara:strand:+ start:7359 stop:8000 length:642 start_codon:yes stop_codon:yes gene_type:complete